MEPLRTRVAGAIKRALGEEPKRNRFKFKVGDEVKVVLDHVIRGTNERRR